VLEFLKNGDEAVKVFLMAHDEREPYDLVCLDMGRKKGQSTKAIYTEPISASYFGR